MTHVLRVLCVGVALAAAPAQQPTPEAPKPAVIRGRVVDAATAKPLAMARMRLASPIRGVPERHTRTNGEGRFEFRDLPAGRFTITASKARYVTLQHGQELPAPSGTPIEVTAGAVLERIDFALPRAAAITGRVVDEYGDPLERAWVEAMTMRYVEGRRRLASVAGSLTDDAGRYRIAALQPGSYYVVAAERAEGFGVEMDADVGFLKTAYPGTTSLAQARRVDVTSGRDTTGIDVALVPAAAARITGTVLGPQGQPLAGVRILAQPIDDGPGGGPGAEVSTTAAGRFVFPKMAPGRYELHARGKTDRFVGAVTPLTVAGDADIVVPVGYGGRLTGRVLVPEGATIAPRDVSITATPVAETFVFGTGFGGAIKEDWTFDWDFLLAKRLLRAQKLPPGWYLKAVHRGEAEITDTPIVFDGDETIDDVTIQLGNDAASVSGTATGPDGTTCPRCTVVVFGDDAARWSYPSRFVHAAVPDQHRAFAFNTLVPARYLIAVVEDLPEGEAFSPAFLERLRVVATPVDLTSTRTASVSLKVVKP